MSLKNIKNVFIQNMIKSIFPNLSAIKSIGVKRVIVNEKKNCISFLFRNRGDSCGASFIYVPASKTYLVEFYQVDESEMFIESKKVYDRLSLDDLLPTFQCETGLLI